MPNCFSLTKIGEEKPANLMEVDTELWNHFEGGEPEGNTKWYRYWHDTIGLELAMGRSFKEIREGLASNSKMGPVVDYLAEHYSARAWAERK